MSRRCSHCNLNGHNSRTCSDRGVRLFGVRLTDSVSSMNMRKSVSMNNLSHYTSAHNPPSPPEHSESGAAPDGYVSDGLVQTSNNARERKKGKHCIPIETSNPSRSYISFFFLYWRCDSKMVLYALHLKTEIDILSIE